MTVGFSDAVSFAHGPEMRNRFMLAPLTNTQSNADGTLSEAEYRWLTMRAAGGFGLTMTCASHVQRTGQGFPGQLGSWDDSHIPGLARLAAGIKEHGSVAHVQLHHAGMRSPGDLIGGAPVSASDDDKTGARAMTTGEVEEMVEAFVEAAVRCEKAGFDGVELHGAHGYLLCQFLSPDINRRTDRYGGSLENRSRPLFDIIDGVRARCGSGFALAVRLSPERFGMRLAEAVEVYERIVAGGKVDLVDMSLWDVTKMPEEDGFGDARLIDVFARLERGRTRLAVAGKIYSSADCATALDAGADIVAIGRGAVLHHDFAARATADPAFRCRDLPVGADVLAAEGLSPAFVGYMRNWPGFVSE